MASQQRDSRENAAAQGDDQGRGELTRDVVQDLRVVFRAIQAHSRWVEKQCGVSAAQLWAMWELDRVPGLRVSELSQALALHQSTTSNLLDKLEAKDLVRRERGGTDQRVVRLYLTDAGRALVERAPRPAQGALSDALDRLPEQTLQALHQSLEAVVGAMTIKNESHGLAPLEHE